MRGTKAKQLRKQVNYKPANLLEDYDFETVTTKFYVDKFVPELGQVVSIPYPMETQVATLKSGSSRAKYKTIKKDSKSATQL